MHTRAWMYTTTKTQRSSDDVVDNYMGVIDRVCIILLAQCTIVSHHDVDQISWMLKKSSFCTHFVSISLFEDVCLKRL